MRRLIIAFMVGYALASMFSPSADAQTPVLAGGSNSNKVVAIGVDASGNLLLKVN